MPGHASPKPTISPCRTASERFPTVRRRQRLMPSAIMVRRRRRQPDPPFPTRPPRRRAMPMAARGRLPAGVGRAAHSAGGAGGSRTQARRRQVHHPARTDRYHLPFKRHGQCEAIGLGQLAVKPGQRGDVDGSLLRPAGPILQGREPGTSCVQTAPIHRQVAKSSRWAALVVTTRSARRRNAMTVPFALAESPPMQATYASAPLSIGIAPERPSQWGSSCATVGW
jgi:hypothetical protein